MVQERRGTTMVKQAVVAFFRSLIPFLSGNLPDEVMLVCLSLR